MDWSVCRRTRLRAQLAKRCHPQYVDGSNLQRISVEDVSLSRPTAEFCTTTPSSLHDQDLAADLSRAGS
jgi:hypothetical protein